MNIRDVILLFGGTSEERLVSVASAQHLCAVLPEATLWFQDRGGRVSPCPREALLAHQDAFTAEFTALGTGFPWRTLPEALDAAEARGKTFLLGLHGGAGEDGSVQRELEQRGLAFTGSGSEASRLGFDKVEAKARARTVGLRVVDSEPLALNDEPGVFGYLERMLLRHGRLVAKPIRGGSSVGLHHVRNVEDARRASRAIAAAKATEYLAEAFVEGTELTVGVVDAPEGPRALPCSEVRLDAGRAFDYEGKYLGKGSTELTPAQVAPDVFAAAQALAISAHSALGCEGYSRTDLIVGREGPVFLEINTLPGLTRASFIPQQLEAEGTSMRDFLEGQLALARRRKK